MNGEAGDDTFFSKDGEKDTINGGAGTDTLLNINGDSTDVLTSIEKRT